MSTITRGKRTAARGGISINALPCLAETHYLAWVGRLWDYTPRQTGNVWWPSILPPFGHVWACLLKQLKTFFLLSCLIGDVWSIWPARTHACYAISLACILTYHVLWPIPPCVSIFDLCVLNRSARAWNINMFVTKHFGIPFGRGLRLANACQLPDFPASFKTFDKIITPMNQIMVDSSRVRPNLSGTRFNCSMWFDWPKH